MEQWIQFQTESSEFIVNLSQISQARYYQEPSGVGATPALCITYLNNTSPNLLLRGPIATDIWNYLESRDEITVIQTLPTN